MSNLWTNATRAQQATYARYPTPNQQPHGLPYFSKDSSLTATADSLYPQQEDAGIACLLIVDDATRWKWTRLLKSISQVAAVFDDFLRTVVRQVKACKTRQV